MLLAFVSLLRKFEYRVTKSSGRIAQSEFPICMHVEKSFLRYVWILLEFPLNRGNFQVEEMLTFSNIASLRIISFGKEFLFWIVNSLFETFSDSNPF